jgi:hypothetical protein
VPLAQADAPQVPPVVQIAPQQKPPRHSWVPEVQSLDVVQAPPTPTEQAAVEAAMAVAAADWLLAAS